MALRAALFLTAVALVEGLQVQRAGPEIAPTGAINPCAGITASCGELVCPGGSKLVTYAGHCCPYCESTVEIVDTKDYSASALKAFNSFGTAPYGGGYKSKPVPERFLQEKK